MVAGCGLLVAKDGWCCLALKRFTARKSERAACCLGSGISVAGIDREVFCLFWFIQHQP